MRQKFAPLQQSCLTRLTTMIDVREREGEPFDYYEDERILSPHEVAYVLDTSTTTVATLVKKGRLQARTFGKVVRFLQSDVLAFIGCVPDETKYAAA